MKYLKVFTDFAEAIEPLGEAEIGRLFMAMLKYAETSELPDLRGNEKFIWPTAKLNIDREREHAEKQAKNGSKGGRPKTQTNPTKPKQSEKSQKDKDKEKTKNNNNPPTPLKGEWDGVSPELHESLVAFEEMRKKIKKPLTDKARQLALSTLHKLSDDEQTQIAIVNQSVLHGWQSFYALKEEEKKEPAEAPPLYKKLTYRR